MKQIKIFSRIFLTAVLFTSFSIRVSANFLYFIQLVDTTEIQVQFDLYKSLPKTDTIRSRLTLEKALNLSRTENYLKGIAESTSYLGTYHYEQFNISKAEYYFKESIETSRKLGNKKMVANNANNLGTIANLKGDYSASISYYLSAIVLLDSLNDKKGMSAVANNLSGVYYRVDQTDKALGFLRMALRIARELNDTVSLIKSFQNLGSIYSEIIKFDSSRFYYQRCIDLSQSINDHKSLGVAYNSLGVIAFRENNRYQASLLFEKALYYSRLSNDAKNLSDTYDNIGLLFFNSDNSDKALAYYDTSLKVSQQYDLKDEMKNVYMHIADVYKSKENYKDAFLNLQNYHNLQDDWLAEKADVTGIEGLFVKLKQENKIINLEKEKEKRKTQIILLMAIILIFLVSGLLGFYIYRITQKSKNARKLADLDKERFKAVIEAQEMERKRIAGDLHDSVGQMLSLSKLHLSEIMDSSSGFSPEQEQILNRSANIIDDACQEVRNISHNLMPGTLIKLGLTSAIKDLVRKINTSKKIQVSFSSNLEENRLDEKIEISLYRIVQEILNNILKHAKATEVAMTIVRQVGGQLDLSITDNGTGFNTEEIHKSNGIGWKNIYSRLSIINGVMEINSHRNRGTSINIKIQ